MGGRGRGRGRGRGQDDSLSVPSFGGGDQPIIEKHDNTQPRPVFPPRELKVPPPISSAEAALIKKQRSLNERMKTSMWNWKPPSKSKSMNDETASYSVLMARKKRTVGTNAILTAIQREDFPEELLARKKPKQSASSKRESLDLSLLEKLESNEQGQESQDHANGKKNPDEEEDDQFDDAEVDEDDEDFDDDYAKIYDDMDDDMDDGSVGDGDEPTY